MGYFDFIGRKQRARQVRPRLAEAAEEKDVETALESIKRLRQKDRELYRVLRKLIEAENFDRALKLMDAFLG